MKSLQKMKKFIAPLLFTAFSMILSHVSLSQSPGLLTFTFTQLPHTSYTGNKNVMAVWIQSNTGTFIETRTRNVGNGTKDHLPTWAVNSGGSANNALGSGCNVVNATTGATYTSFTTRTVTWDGLDASGNMVPDGTYKITIQSTWDHGSSGTTTRSFTFVKGPTDDITTPTADANFSNISLQWIASQAGIDEAIVAETGVKVYPNPSQDGLFTVDYEKANSIVVYDVLGNKISEETLSSESGSVVMDLSALESGFYFLHVTDGTKSSEHKVAINK